MGRRSKESLVSGNESNNLDQLDKLWGEISEIISDINTQETSKRVSLSWPALNYLFGGGLNTGRIVEVYGAESSGKSLLSYVIGSDIQKEGRAVVYIDYEKTFSKNFAARFGLVTDNSLFRLLQPEVGEDAFRIIEKSLSYDKVGLIVVDSVSAMTPSEEFDADYTDVQMGAQSRMMSKGLRKITAHLGSSDCIILFINQTRSKIGTLYGSPVTTSGGNALKFYASLRLEVHKSGSIPEKLEGKSPLGFRQKIKVIKNKMGVPLRELVVSWYYKTGMDRVEQILDLADIYGLITKRGAHFELDGLSFHGYQRLVDYARQNIDLTVRLEEKLKNLMEE